MSCPVELTTPGGESLVVVPVPADVSAASLMAVTVEQGRVGAPTSDPIFTAPIQA